MTSSFPHSRGYGGRTASRESTKPTRRKFQFIALIRLPDFVIHNVFDWAVQEAAAKKKIDLANVEFLTMHEGRCVQALHVGPYDQEPATVSKMHDFIAAQGLQVNINDHRHHHEIYLSDPRRTKAANLRTGIRIPVK